VLSRISGILAGRAFNIDSLVVCSTEIRDLSRMTIVLRGQDGVIEQARRQLEDLVGSYPLGFFFGLSRNIFSLTWVENNQKNVLALGTCLGCSGLYGYTVHRTRALAR
jgi:ACT domain